MAAERARVCAHIQRANSSATPDWPTREHQVRASMLWEACNQSGETLGSRAHAKSRLGKWPNLEQKMPFEL